MRKFTGALSKVEMRAFPRERVNRRAKVLDGPFALDATIRNISTGGAMVSFHGRTSSGEETVLIDLETATAYLCRVAWRDGADHGMRFLKTQDLRGLVPGQFDLARRVYQAAMLGGA